MLFVHGPNTRPANPRWRTAAILEKSIKRDISVTVGRRRTGIVSCESERRGLFRKTTSGFVKALRSWIFGATIRPFVKLLWPLVIVSQKLKTTFADFNQELLLIIFSNKTRIRLYFNIWLVSTVKPSQFHERAKCDVLKAFLPRSVFYKKCQR